VAKLIGEFLLELDKDKHRMDAYRRDPEKAMEEGGLDENQRKILLSNDLHRIREEIHKEYREAKVVVVPFFMMNVSVGGPGQS
jgi:hypothetical protein